MSIGTATRGPQYRAHLLCDPCCYCGAPAEVLDHIVPRADGGGHKVDNLTASCGPCNSAKSGRSLLGFLGWRRLRFDTDHIVLPILAERGHWSVVGR